VKKFKALEMLAESANIQGVIVIRNETYRHLYEKDPITLLFSWTLSGPPPGGVIVHCPVKSPCHGREEEILDVIAEGVKLSGVDPSGIVVVFDRLGVKPLIITSKIDTSPPILEPIKTIVLTVGLIFGGICIALGLTLLKRNNDIQIRNLK